MPQRLYSIPLPSQLGHWSRAMSQKQSTRLERRRSWRLGSVSTHFHICNCRQTNSRLPCAKSQESIRTGQCTLFFPRDGAHPGRRWTPRGECLRCKVRIFIWKILTLFGGLRKTKHTRVVSVEIVEVGSETKPVNCPLNVFIDVSS